MKIQKIAYNASDIEKIYDLMKEALDHLNMNYVGKAKIDIKKTIKQLEILRPHLKYKDRPVLGRW